MHTLTEHPHIVRDSAILGGEPIIKGTRTPVRAVVEMWRAGFSPDEIVARLPHISLAQTFDSLGFFEDHTPEILEQIEKNKVDQSLLDAKYAQDSST